MNGQDSSLSIREHRTDAEVLGDELRRLANEAQEWARRAASEVGNREAMRRERDAARQQLAGAVEDRDRLQRVVDEAYAAADHEDEATLSRVLEVLAPHVEAGGQ